MPVIFITEGQRARLMNYAGDREDDDVLRALGDPVKDGDVLVMTPQTVREHIEGNEELEAVLKRATDEEIAEMLGDDGIYNAWHGTCMDVAVALAAKQREEEPDPEYERAQASEEWERRHGGGL